MREPAAALILGVVLVTAGCLGVFQAEPSDPGAEAAVDDAVAAGESVDTYRVRSRIVAVAKPDTDRRELAATSVGVVDRSARTLRQNVTQDGEHRSVYLVGNVSYTECGSPWNGWGREEHPELDRDWADHDPLGRLLTLLAESPVVWIGNDTLRGTPVHVVQGHPSARTLTQFSDDPKAPLDVTGPRVRNASIRAWLARDSGRLLEARVTFELRGDDATVETRMTTTFTDYGVDAEITLPPAATEDPYRAGCPG